LKNNTTKISITPASIIIFFSFILLLIFIYQIRDVLLLLFASFVIASALFPIVDWLSKKVPRGIVVLFVYLVGLLVMLTLLIPFITVIVQQTEEFMEKFPGYWDQITRALSEFEIFAQSQGFIPDYSQMFSNMSDIGQDIVSKSIGFTINLFAGIAGAFTLAVIVLFLLLDKESLAQDSLKLFPPKYREQVKHIIGIISRRVGGYVRGQIILMIAVGVLTAIGLKIVGMEFALLLGITAGLLEIIPIVGPIIAAVPAIIIALAHDPLLALWVFIVYMIVQRLENHILTPMILGTFLEMHPLIIIIAILIAASTLGVFGVILSPALAASIYILFQELYLKKINPESEELL